jgi:arsenite methyltransferase
VAGGAALPFPDRGFDVHDPWLGRRLPALVRGAGLELESVRSHGYVETLQAGFMLSSWVDLGADTLQASGRTSSERAAELKAEARRRVAEGTYFGHIAYLSVVARRSA